MFGVDEKAVLNNSGTEELNKIFLNALHALLRLKELLCGLCVLSEAGGRDESGSFVFTELLANGLLKIILPEMILPKRMILPMIGLHCHSSVYLHGCVVIIN